MYFTNGGDSALPLLFISVVVQIKLCQEKCLDRSSGVHKNSV